MKICCYENKQLQTCADYREYASCLIIHEWFNKKGYKYKKYKESVEFIRKSGYDKFLQKPHHRKNQHRTRH